MSTPDRLNPAARSRGVQISLHARIRAQQRGVRMTALDALLRYGTECHDHLGALVVIMNRRALDEVRRQEPEVWPQIRGARGLYAVVDGSGAVVTTGHRHRRITRDRSLSNLRPRDADLHSH